MLKKERSLLSILRSPSSPRQLSAQVWPLSRAPAMPVPIPGLGGAGESSPVLIRLALKSQGLISSTWPL